MSSNYFAALSAINVNDHIEKEGGFSYLSWPWAVSQLRLTDPAACWEVKRFDGLPYLACEIGVFVEVAARSRASPRASCIPCWTGAIGPSWRPQRSTSTPASSVAWSRPSRCTGWGCTSTLARTCHRSARTQPMTRPVRRQFHQQVRQRTRHQRNGTNRFAAARSLRSNKGICAG